MYIIVKIEELYNRNKNATFSYARARSVALQPDYARPNSGRRLLAGAGDRVVKTEKSMLKYWAADLCGGGGEVADISWGGR